MTSERLAKIRKTLKAVKCGECLHHYQSYILDVTDCIAHIKAQDKRIKELEVDNARGALKLFNTHRRHQMNGHDIYKIAGQCEKFFPYLVCFMAREEIVYVLEFCNSCNDAMDFYDTYLNVMDVCVLEMSGNEGFILEF